MNRKLHVSLFLTMGIFVAAPLSARADSRNPSEKGAPEELIGFDFDGGTLGDYLRDLHAAAGGANVVPTDARATKIKLPMIQLNSVSLETALRLIEGEHILDEETTLTLHIERIGSQNVMEKPVYRLSVESSYKPKAHVKVWNVIDLFDDRIKPEDVLTAVENAIDLMSKDSSKVEVRFHAETGVLIARGLFEQVTLIDNLIGELRGHMVLRDLFGGLAQGATEQREPGDAIKVIMKEIEGLKTKVEDLDRRVRDITRD